MRSDVVEGVRMLLLLDYQRVWCSFKTRKHCVYVCACVFACRRCVFRHLCIHSVAWDLFGDTSFLTVKYLQKINFLNTKGKDLYLHEVAVVY